MSKQPSQPPDGVRRATIVLGDIADTTWRMFLPSVGFTLLGLWADHTYGTLPWLLIAGIIIGVIVAGLLVWRQIAKLSDTK